MQTEIEAKFIKIDKDEIRARLQDLGATLVCEERLMRRKTFDFPNKTLFKKRAYIRVRDEGDKVTTTFKCVEGEGVHGTKELEAVVSGFDDMCAIYERLGLKEKSYKETRREEWELDGVRVTIDSWPWVEPFVELEGESEAALKAVADKLNFTWDEALFGTVEVVYQEKYDVSQEEINFWPEFVFSPVPEWFEKRQKYTSEV